MEKCFEFQQKIFLCFIDYSMAFDCVRYSALWTALQEMGIPSYLTHLIRNIYDGQAACNSSIEPVESARNLGVVVQNDLKMDLFVNNICRSASFSL